MNTSIISINMVVSTSMGTAIWIPIHLILLLICFIRMMIHVLITMTTTASIHTNYLHLLSLSLPLISTKTSIFKQLMSISLEILSSQSVLPLLLFLSISSLQHLRLLHPPLSLQSTTTSTWLTQSVLIYSLFWF